MHRRFVPPLIHQDHHIGRSARTYVHTRFGNIIVFGTAFLKRQCDRTLGAGRFHVDHLAARAGDADFAALTADADS